MLKTKYIVHFSIKALKNISLNYELNIKNRTAMGDGNKLNVEYELILYRALSKVKYTLDKGTPNRPLTESKINSIRSQMSEIEHKIESYKKSNLHWTKEDIYYSYGMSPTVILYFYPNTKSYEKYGDELLVNIKFSSSEFQEIINNIQNNLQQRKAGLLTFTRDINFEELAETESIDTDDIFKVAGRNIR